MTELGLIENYLRLPLVPLSGGVHQLLKAYLKKLMAGTQQRASA